MIASLSLPILAVLVVAYLLGVVSGWHFRERLAPLDRADDGGPPI